MAACDTGAGALLGTLGLEPEVTRQEPAEADLCFARICFNLCSSFGVLGRLAVLSGGHEAGSCLQQRAEST